MQANPKRPDLSPPTSPSSVTRILVVDDERMLAKMFGEMLSLRGYFPTVCHSARQALELVKNLEFDLVLSDYAMPLMSGKEFFRAATLFKPGLARRFIFLTGDLVQEETRAFLDSVGTPYLAKPFPLATLEKVVANLLRANAGLDHASLGAGDCLALCA